LDPDGPVTMTIDLGSARKLSAAEVLWEFPAKAFTISVSTDGIKWSEVYATDSNVLTSTSVPLGSITASKVRVVMHEASVFLYAVVGLTSDRLTFRRQQRHSRVTVFMASDCCPCTRSDYKLLSKTVLPQRKAMMLGTSISRHM